MNERTKLLLIALVALLLRLVACAGYVGGDDWHYLTSAVELARGELSPGGGHWQYRSGVTVPAALLYKAGAPAWMVLSGATFVWSLLCVVIAYWAGIEFTRDKRTALLSAGLVAIFPLDIIYATCLYPILGIALFTALSGIFFSRALRTQSKLDYVALGASLGVAYLFRVTSLYVGIPMLIWAIWKKEWHRGYLIAAATGLLFVVFEMALYGMVDEYPLQRWRVLTARSEVQANVERSYADSAIRPGGPVFSPLVSLVTNQEFGLFYVALPFALFALFRAQRRARSKQVSLWPPHFAFLLLWLLTVLAYTLWGTTNPFEYKPLRPWPRYFSHVTIPLCVVLAFWLTHCLRTRTRYVVIVSLALVALLGVAVDRSRSFRTLGPELLEIRREHPAEPFRVVRHAYLFMYTANNLVPPEGVDFVALHRDGEDPRAELVRQKIAPDAPLFGPWDSLDTGYVVITAGSEERAPDRWEKVAYVRRAKSFLTTVADKIGGILGRVLRRSEAKHDFVVFRVP